MKPLVSASGFLFAFFKPNGYHWIIFDTYRLKVIVALNKKQTKIDTPSVVNIGLIVDADNYVSQKWTSFLIENLDNEFSRRFPCFSWEFSIVERQDFPKNAPVDPLFLLEYGADIKIEYGFDYVLLVTTLPLLSRFEQGINGVPSNLLEAAVVSLSKILELPNENLQRKAFLSLTKHCLGHLWGLDHSANTVMKPRKFWTGQPPLDWDKKEEEQIKQNLKEIADPRIEERGGIKSKWRFYVKMLQEEGLSILKDVLVVRSALMMFHLGRSTAATAVSIIFLFLSAEAWEIGSAMDSAWLDFALVFVIICATLSFYFGQNLQSISRSDKLKEQAVRSRLVLLGTIFMGMFSFWINLFVISYIVINILPQGVLAEWAGIHGKPIPDLHFSKLMATFGLMASAIGGNLEKEQDIKALLIYTEET